jgi:hypothetical protein
VTLLPNERIGLVVLANQNGAALPELLARTVMDRLLGAERKNWIGDALTQARAAQAGSLQMEARKGEARVPGTQRSHPLAAYVGTYADSGYGAAEITLDRDTLVFTYNRIVTRMAHWHYDTFSGIRNAADPTFADAQLTFRTNAKGNVDALLAPFDAAVPAIVMLRQPDAKLRDAVFLETLTGRYRLPTGQIVTVSRRGETLLFQQGAGAPTEMEPEQGTSFVLRANRAISMTFRVDASGKVTGMRGVQPGAVFDAPRVP